MTLAAQQVTDALAERLMAQPATGGRVLRSRTTPVAEADLPCWRVVAGGEAVSSFSSGGINLHQLDVLAAVYARDTYDVDDVLARLLAGGQALLFGPPVPFDLKLARVDRGVAGEGEASAGVYTLTLRATYAVHPAQPETLLSN